MCLFWHKIFLKIYILSVFRCFTQHKILVKLKKLKMFIYLFFLITKKIWFYKISYAQENVPGFLPLVPFTISTPKNSKMIRIFMKPLKITKKPKIPLKSTKYHFETPND